VRGGKGVRGGRGGGCYGVMQDEDIGKVEWEMGGRMRMGEGVLEGGQREQMDQGGGRRGKGEG